MNSSATGKIGVTSGGIAKIPFIDVFLGARTCRVSSSPAKDDLVAIAGWGTKPSGQRAAELAARLDLPAIFLEDGFLRSYFAGKDHPPLSIVRDSEGIYYDSRRPSTLESLLNSKADLMAGIGADVERARRLILEHRLSKYNHAPDLDEKALRPGDVRRVLVIDQTAGDNSVAMGGATADTFEAMLAAARLENPDATVYVKTHPEVTSGQKRGYLSHVQDDERTVLLRDAINPLSLIEKMDRVYAVTSTMGFEALLAGKQVSVFGVPWYSGWGPTDDRQPCPRRTHKRTVDELFAAAYFHYTTYLDPVRRTRGTIFDVIDWLVLQKRMAARFTGRMICLGLRRWKAATLRPLLSMHPERVHFVADVARAKACCPQPGDCLVVWGRDLPPGLEALATATGAQILHMEDGFIRSVGLGSDFIKPYSIVLDSRGIYFDPGRPSDLEDILNSAAFAPEELALAARLRKMIVDNGITKYNVGAADTPDWRRGERQVVLVPGQVEDDASIRYGCPGIRTNADLLAAARAAHPEAFIVYKPHPDVASGNRAGYVPPSQLAAHADHVETERSVIGCIEACDVVHTMTSLTGYDALLRGKRVVVYGLPFYAGWGLTDDIAGADAFARRERKLTLEELVAGTLVKYPLYWDWDLKTYASCEATLRRIMETRPNLDTRRGKVAEYVLRKLRKLRLVTAPWMGR
ncbi:capsular polysaccharide biosynthesis protein [Ciceribacter selenitireducens]